MVIHRIPFENPNNAECPRKFVDLGEQQPVAIGRHQRPANLAQISTLDRTMQV
jgi:hypothetical protein